MPSTNPYFAIGLGCRRDCPLDVLLAIVHSSLAKAQLDLSAVGLLASIDSKCNEPGLNQLAERLQIPIVFFTSRELLRFDTRLSHRSVTAFNQTGCYGVAESTAMAAAEQLLPASPTSELLMPRRTSPQATLAIARASL